MKTVGILGCGWLGKALAQKLLEKGYQVKGSSTSLEKVKAIEQLGVKGYVVVLQSNKINGDLTFFDSIEVLFICIPPKQENLSFKLNQSIFNLFEQIPSLSNTKVLFTSSISVYGNQSGAKTEQSKLFPETENAKQLVASEKLVIDSFKNSVVIRLGGLIGEDRNPIKSLLNKPIGNPYGFINFIPQNDAVEGLLCLLLSDASGVFNLVAPHHPTRKEYYTYAAQKFGYPSPKFSSDEGIRKIVKGDKITRLCLFKYTVNNLLI